MNDLAMQKERPRCRSNVRELPGTWLGHRGIEALYHGVRGSSHPVKVDVRLVSLPWPAFEMTSPQTKIRGLHTASPPQLLLRLPQLW